MDKAASKSGEGSKAPPEATKHYAFELGNRVKSFGNDALHSRAYLAYLARYLKAPFQRPHRWQPGYEKPTPTQRTFIQQYLLLQGKAPQVKPFQDPSSFEISETPAGNEILFLTGRASAEWLNCIGSKYSVDYRFFHQHLGTVLSGSQHSYAVPDLPSRSLQVLCLQIPTIAFVGSRGRNLDINGLEFAREDSNAQLQKSFLSLQNSAQSEAGRSIVRKVQIFDGSTLVIEQQMTATIIERGQHWTSRPLQQILSPFY